MLTKQERAAIAKSVTSFKGVSLCYSDIYRCLFDKKVPSDTTIKEDDKAILDRIIDLCDTSNMIELPLDKDGVPFKRGDTVYESDGTEYKVDGYTFTRVDTKILSVVDPINNAYAVLNSDELTHKKPVTIASLAKELTDIVTADYGTPMVVKHKISDIAEQLESLGDSDD